jgi:hypothetical protein
MISLVFVVVVSLLYVVKSQGKYLFSYRLKSNGLMKIWQIQFTRESITDRQLGMRGKGIIQSKPYIQFTNINMIHNARHSLEECLWKELLECDLFVLIHLISIILPLSYAVTFIEIIIIYRKYAIGWNQMV